MHEWHRDASAVFEPVGDWLRARAYPKAGESFHDAVQREAKAARTTIGVLDASTLGKIDVKGPDAREFLNRVYINAWMKLGVGKCRYGLMLGEDGMVMDDGVTACLADDHFHMTTTTGGAARVLGKLEDYLQTEWPELKVYLTSVTEEWAVVSLCGPDCDKLVGELCDDLDPDPEKFEFMTWRDAHRRRHAGSRLPRLLHRRALLRDQHPGDLRPVALGAGDGEGREIRDRALRHGGDASPARREGFCHRRPGDGRNGDARRPRLRRDGEEDAATSSAAARSSAPTRRARIAGSSSGS